MGFPPRKSFLKSHHNCNQWLCLHSNRRKSAANPFANTSENRNTFKRAIGISPSPSPADRSQTLFIGAVAEIEREAETERNEHTQRERQRQRQSDRNREREREIRVWIEIEKKDTYFLNAFLCNRV